MAQDEPEGLIERLCFALVGRGLLSEKQLSEAKERQIKTGESIGDILVDLNLVSPEDISLCLEEELEIPWVDLSSYIPEKEALNLVPEQFVRKYLILPLFIIEGVLTVALSNPLDIFVLESIKKEIGCKLEPVLSSEESIIQAIAQYYGERPGAEEKEVKEPPLKEEKVKKEEKKEKREEREIKELVATEKVEEVEEKSVIMSGEEFKGEIVKALSEDETFKIIEVKEEEIPLHIDLERLAVPDPVSLNNLFLEIIKKAKIVGSRSIHIEPGKTSFDLIFRIDNSLTKVGSAPLSLASPLVSKIKSLANFPDEKFNRIREGEIELKEAGFEVNLKVSILPTYFGERVVLTFLTQKAFHLSFEELGLSHFDLNLLKKVFRERNGLIILSAPHNSGKTTTFQATLTSFELRERNKLALVDTFQREISQINQVITSELKDLSTSELISSFVTQDLNLIGIDEIKEVETIKSIIKLALRDTLVVGTFVASNVFDTLNRFFELGLERFSLSWSLKAILNQRLVKKNCPNCREKVKVEQLDPSLSHLFPEKELVFYQGKGCKSCNKTGYSGLTGIFELLVVNKEIGHLISSFSPLEKICEVAKEEGMKSLLENGVDKALEGVTTLEEVLRVTQ